MPEVVARLHRNAFREPPDSSDRPIFFVTLHASSSTTTFPLVLFANGDVATWSQTPAGAEQPFFATLNARELKQATELVDAIDRLPPTRADDVEAAAQVMGASTRHADRIATRFFELRKLPPALAQLVALLKARLEATNGAP
ncbi:MAG: hypothetical protein R3B13_08835 [Polyangiaceae bacterium]